MTAPALTGAKPAAPSRNSRSSRSQKLAAVCLLLVGSMARTGFAADAAVAMKEAPLAEGERVVQLNEEGNALYAAADYRRAAERFLQAYAVDEDPNLLFNIASCYEALGDVDAALEKYRAFLADPHADPEGRPRAEQAIERLTALESPPAVETPVPVAPAPPSVPAQGAGETPMQDAGWVPWVGLGSGLALGALGGVFYLMGAADHSQVSDTPGFGDPDSVAGITRGRADDLVRSGDTKKAIGVASASAGAALIVGSVVWWLVDARSDATQPEASTADRGRRLGSRIGLDVTLNASEAGARFSGAF